MMLKDKVAVIYGAGGAIGGAVAHAFARDGAKLFLTGRRRAQGIPETGRIKESFGLYAKASRTTWEQFQELLASSTHTRRLSTLAETANVAVFMASDGASGMTGTVVNLSMGSLDD
jgi:NAD(P)-dependent dehydrogenase (short-subunit alcohol dehydrogenase family)